jgi:hypothetical protein
LKDVLLQIAGVDEEVKGEGVREVAWNCLHAEKISF